MRTTTNRNATLIMLALAGVWATGCTTCTAAPHTSDTSEPAGGAREVTVDWGVEHQVIDNFGASDCWRMQKIGAWSDESKNCVADLLFSKAEGIGLSCWRFNLGGGLDYEHMGADSWRTVETFEVAEGQYDWTRQARERWFLGAAKARGVKQFVAFCNSPPGRMTRNGRTFCSDKEGSTNLKEGYEGQFARYLADILQFFHGNPDESQRIDFDWVSPINEPQWLWIGGGQEGCRASNRDIKNIVLALYKELRGRGLKTNILVPESGSVYGMRAPEIPIGCREKRAEYAKRGDYFDEFCGDPAVKDKIGNVICSHSYGFDKVPELLVPQRIKFREKFDEYPGWRYWMTEYCPMQGPENKGGGGRDLTIKTALDVARVIHYDLTICNASAWQWWTAVSAADYKDGLIYTDYHKEGDPETIYPAKLLWAFGNYSRFIRPGARRIECTGAADVYGLLGSAYKNATGNEIAIVFINMAETKVTVSLRLKGLPDGKTVKAFTPHVTSENDDLKAYPPVAADGDYVVSERSAVTLVGSLAPAP
jgi:O-glycosyl hydrolase